MLVLIGVDNKCYFQYIYMMQFQKHCNIGGKKRGGGWGVGGGGGAEEILEQ